VGRERKNSRGARSDPDDLANVYGAKERRKKGPKMYELEQMLHVLKGGLGNYEIRVVCSSHSRRATGAEGLRDRGGRLIESKYKEADGERPIGKGDYLRGMKCLVGQ